MSLAIGVCAAAAASTLYNAGVVIQADASRHEPVGAAFSPRLLGRLLQRRRWLAGSAVALLGWPLQALALTRAPLTVVQPTLAVGLVVPLVFGTRVLGEHARRRDAAAVAVLALGVSLLVVAAPPRTAHTATQLGLAIALSAMAAVVLAALLLTAVARLGRAHALIVAAGVGFALASITTKLLADAFSRHAWLALVVWLAVTAAAAGLALLGEMNALQIRAASTVASLVFALETVVPVALSPILFGETGSASAGTLALRALALITTIGAATTLTRTEPINSALAERPQTGGLAADGPEPDDEAPSA